LGKLVNEYNIAVALLPPALASLLAIDHLKPLQYLIVGGESCDITTMIRFSQHCQVFNAYGPTENTVTSTIHAFSCGDGSTNIGKPLGNVQAFVVDVNFQLVPIGVPGELLVGGMSVSRGYLNHPDSTEERFVDNPFSPGERVYRTGDLVRWFNNGDLGFLGRINSQVKLRGFRIELGEIESVLSTITGVLQACVILKGQRLDAYLVGDCNAETIRDVLEKQLPEYMVPSTFTIMEVFPRTINGKLDTKSFPEPTISNNTLFVPPENHLQEKLSLIWIEILSRKREISVNDNFFRIGGDSIKSILLVARLSLWCLDERHTSITRECFHYFACSLIISFITDNPSSFHLTSNGVFIELKIGLGVDLLFNPILI